MKKTKFERSHSSFKKGKSEISISWSPRNKSSLKYKEIKELIDNNSVLEKPIPLIGKSFCH